MQAFGDLAEGTAGCPPGCTHLEPDCALDAWVAARGGGPLAVRLDSLRRLLRSLEGLEPRRFRLLTGPSPRNTAETRHPTVSLLDDAGSTIEDISALVRHKKSQVTRIVYRHRSNAPAARTAAAKDAIYLAASGGHHDQSRRLPG